MRNPTEHFYNEIYSYYYETVGKLINLALNEELTPEKEKEVLHETPGFSNDMVIDKLHIFNEWFLLDNKLTKTEDKHHYGTDIVCEYKRPVSLLEKRWLRSVVTDPRIQLFGMELEKELSDVEPLFRTEDFISVGTYNDGDNYSDENYRKIFRTVLKAIKEGWGLKIMSENRYGELSPEAFTFVPEHIEYSEIEDKFSVYGYSPNEYGNGIIRMDRIKSCELCHREERISDEEDEKGELTIILDGYSARTQNALERILIEFSHYNKKVRETEEGDYVIEIEYAKREEKELTALRLMPFAHYIKVLSPDSIKNEIKERIAKQYRIIKSKG